METDEQKFSISQIEQLSVNTISNTLLRSKLIIPEFRTNDRTPSWDGDIYLYNSSKHSKDELIGKCPVQIKGKTKIANINSPTVKFSVDVSDLHNYKENGGVIYFVCNIIDPEHVCVYYKLLLPFDITVILKHLKDEKQQQAKLEFKKFPFKFDDIEHVVRLFIRESKKQYSNTPNEPMCEKLMENPESIREFIGGSFNFTVDEKYMFDEPVYVYLTFKNMPGIPVLNCMISKQTVNNIPLSIKADGKVYFKRVCGVRSRDNIIIKFGAGYSIEIDLTKETHNTKLHYKLAGSAEEVLYDLKFLSELVRGVELKMGEWVLTEHSSMTTSPENVIINMKLFEEICELFKMLGVKKYINFENFSNDDYKKLEGLYNLMKLNTIPNPKNIVKKTVGPFVIGKIRIGLIEIKEMEQTRTTYFNLFAYPNLSINAQEGDLRGQVSSYFTVLRKQELLDYVNVDYEVIVKAIKGKKYCAYHGICTNCLILEMLEAYDTNKDQIILDAAIDIADWLKKHEHNSIYIINYYQAIWRKRKFTEAEEEEIIDFKRNERELDCLAGFAALLGYKEEFKSFFKKLDENKRKEMLHFPIAKLIQRLS